MVVDSETFRQGMRRLPSGVSIVTAMGATGPAGLTATAVSSLSDQPPSLLCCVSNTLAAHQAIRHSGAFCVNLLAEGQHDLADRFAGRSGARGGAKFAAGTWSKRITGAPVLAECLASFDCRLGAYLETATHTIFTGLIADITFAEARRPLIYVDGGFAHPGDGYAIDPPRPMDAATGAAT